MKAQIKILSIILATAASYSAHASDIGHKEHTRIEFNSMIDQNNSTKDQLQKSVSNKMAVQDEESASADQKKVMDLVDVEVGVREDKPTVVDRRYNSVGEPIVDKTFSNAKVQLVDDKKEDQGS